MSAGSCGPALLNVGAADHAEPEGPTNKSAPAIGVAPPAGALPTSKGLDRLMTSVERTSDTPPPVFHNMLGRADGCPSCVANTEAPIDAYPTEGGYVATYRCSDCGHKWSTAWSED